MRIFRAYTRPKHAAIDRGALQRRGRITETLAPWAYWAVHCTTAQFHTVDGVTYHNNCGPTAVTNLLCMVKGKRRGAPLSREEAARLYDPVARFGTKWLFFFNSEGPVKGTSDLRAGHYVSAMFLRTLGIPVRLRVRRLTEEALRESLGKGALLYLVLWNHPEYGTHHLVGYGLETVRNPDTGTEATYLLVCDGHNPGPRYLALSDFQDRLAFYYEVTVPGLRNR